MGRNRQTGFTLIEAIITVAIMAIIAAIGVPSYQSMIRESRLSSITEEMMMSLMLANTEATMRGRNVVVCAASGTGCGGNDWRNGHRVFVDNNKNNTFESAASEPEILLRLSQAVTGVGSASAASTFFTFQPLLRAESANKVITFCSVGAKTRTLTVNKFGAVKNEQGSSNATACP